MKNHLPTKKELLNWIDALRSGKYSQAKERLQDEDSYCCLGVACKIFIPAEKQKTDDGILTGVLPTNQKFAPSWLRRIDSRFNRFFGKEVSVLNDNFDYSFDEIADLLIVFGIEKGILTPNS